MSKKSNTNEFIAKATKVHNGKYSYADCVYTRAKDKCTITCKVHGNFKQKATHHLSGSGCPKCWKSNKSFLSRAKELHKERYDYSLVKYVDTCTKVDIICNLHGVFKQRPNDHTRGQGCPKCAADTKGGWSEQRYKDKKTTLYCIQFGYNLFKIGLTRTSIKQRYSKESVIYSTVFTKEFENGAEAFRIEQKILADTIKYKTNKQILSHGGNSEIRECSLTDLVLNGLK